MSHHSLIYTPSRVSRSFSARLVLATLLVGTLGLLMTGCSFGASSQLTSLPPAQQVLRIGLVTTNHIVPVGAPGSDSGLLGPDETTNTAGTVALARQLLQSYADDQCGGRFSGCPPVFMPYGPCGSEYPPSVTITDAAVQMWK